MHCYVDGTVDDEGIAQFQETASGDYGYLGITKPEALANIDHAMGMQQDAQISGMVRAADFDRVVISFDRHLPPEIGTFVNRHDVVLSLVYNVYGHS